MINPPEKRNAPKVLAGGRAGISVAKVAIGFSLDTTKENADGLTSTFYEEAFRTEDSQRGVKAFLEKRKPVFEWR